MDVRGINKSLQSAPYIFHGPHHELSTRLDPRLNFVKYRTTAKLVLTSAFCPLGWGSYLVNCHTSERGRKARYRRIVIVARCRNVPKIPIDGRLELIDQTCFSISENGLPRRPSPFNPPSVKLSL